jgi:hypothetical protein
MRRTGSECTRRISPAETGTGKPMMSLQASRSRTDRERPRQVRGVCGSRLLRRARRTAARFYRRARASVLMAFRSASNKRTSSSAASPECTPSRNSSRRQQPAAPVVVVDDSHKSEAVEECIRFMNSSSRKYR